jgi:hypothetical protein
VPVSAAPVQVNQPTLTWLAEGLRDSVTRLDRSVVIGRDPQGCDVLLVTDVTSRQHASVVIDPQGNALLVDLGSSNGTFVNGLPVTRALLMDGDRIGFGSAAEAHCVFRAAQLSDEQLQRLSQVDATEAPTSPFVFGMPRRPKNSAGGGESGERVRNLPACHSCGAATREWGSFCHRCGASLKSRE